MNTITKMYLISEDQYKRNLLKPNITRRILNKNLPAETKVRFINNLLARKSDQYAQFDDNEKDKEEEEEEDNSDQYINTEFSDANQSFYDTTDNKLDEKTLPGFVTPRVSPERSFYESLDKTLMPIHTSTPSTSQQIPESQQKQIYRKTPFVKPSAASPLSTERFVLNLKAIKGLSSRDGTVLSDGLPVQGSDIRESARVLKDPYYKDKFPNGTVNVLRAIVGSNLESEIVNKKALEQLEKIKKKGENLTWRQATHLKKI